MAFLYRDRVKDTTTSTGTGDLTLANSAPSGFQTLATAGFANGDTFFYCVEGGSEWEVGRGTYSTTGPALQRTQVLASSNSGSAVNFSAGTKRVFVTVPAAMVGTVIDRAYAEYTASSDLTAQIAEDDTIPQNTEGTEILTASITPKSVTNRVRVRFQGYGGTSGSSEIVAALFKDSGADALCAAISVPVGSSGYSPILLDFEHVPATTSQVTYKVRVGPSSAVTARLNGLHNARRFGGASRATLILEEIVA